MNGTPIFGTERCSQIGLLVHDIDKSAQAYADFLGVPKPEIVMTGEYEAARTEYLGKPTRARCKQAFFYYNDVQVELIEPDQEPSIWRQALDEHGEGIHHLAFHVHDMERNIRLGEEHGMKLIQRGRWDTGHYAYLEAQDSLHTTIELLEDGEFEI